MVTIEGQWKTYSPSFEAPAGYGYMREINQRLTTVKDMGGRFPDIWKDHIVLSKPLPVNQNQTSG